MKVWVIAEHAALGAELAGGAKGLGGNVEVVAFTAGDAAIAGADFTHLLPLPEAAPWEAYFPILAEKAAADAPDVILVGASKRGRTLAGLLAARLDAPCIADCRNLRVESGETTAERMVYGGLAVKKLRTAAKLVIAVVGRGVYEPAGGGSGKTETLAPPPCRVRVTGRAPKEAGSVNLAEAARVVGVGRGFEDKADLESARELCAALGAELACSRPIAEFFKWLPESSYLGISGQVIKPKLYVACGISGQAQHLYGVRDAGIIVAINKDEKAAIMEHADYAIIGDLKEILPALSAALRG